MRVVLQRVSQADVVIKHEIEFEVSKTKKTIGQGLVIFLGITEGDTQEDVTWLVKKISQIRLFDSDASKGVGDSSLLDLSGEALVISQFTLFASYKKGTKPSYHRAARPSDAIPLYELFLKSMEQVLEGKVKSGVFGAGMKVSLTNEGPVTLILDSKNKE
ncbi:MAG: D-aminoacyl-tRNA deacylase [Verrucomicrobiota bacterium]